MAFQYLSSAHVDEELLMRLKELRTFISVEKNYPAYMVFPDKTLEEMASRFPTTLGEMESIYGVGKTKLRQYGEVFLSEILRYIEERNSVGIGDNEEAGIPQNMSSGVNDLRISVSTVSYSPIEIENFEEICRQLDYYLEFYRNAAYTPENLQQAITDKTNLNRLKKVLTVKRKEIKDTCLEPFRSVEVQFKELISMIDAPLASIAEFTEEMEQVRKDEKCAEIKLYYDQNTQALGPVAAEIFSKPWFYNKKWENKTCKEYQWKAELRDKIATVAEHLQIIKNASGPHTAAVIAKYVETGSKIEAARYLKAITDIVAMEETESLVRTLSDSVTPIAHSPETPDRPTVSPVNEPVVLHPDPVLPDPTDEALHHEYIFRIRLNEKQYQLLTTFMELSNISYEIVP